MWRNSEEHKSKSLVTVKLLILLHNFLRKGPIEAMTFTKQYNPIKLCCKIYNHWKMTQHPTSSEDFKRNVYLVLLIRFYCLVIIGKVKLCYENCDLIQGNFSIVPYLTSKDESTILKFSFLESMLDFLEICCTFHETIHKHSYLVDIQRAMILSIVD